MPFQIVFTDNARSHFSVLDARWRSTLKASIMEHLAHEPAKVSKSRIKRLRHLRQPQFRLRVEDVRVFYDIEGNRVVILAIVPKDNTSAWLDEHGLTDDDS